MQLAPSSVEYAQLLILIDDLTSTLSSGEEELTPEEIAVEIKNIITKYNDISGQPLLAYEVFELGEPPRSDKMNRIFRMLEGDVNICESQLEVLRAAIVYLYNYIVTEIEQSKKENSKLSNKLKTLQLYTTAHDSDVVQFGDFFSDLDFVDFTATTFLHRAELIAPGQLGLAPVNSAVDLTNDSVLKILDTSNGFLGNNHELSESSVGGQSLDGEADFRFKAEDGLRNGELKSVIDGQPNTWFEYEAIQVSENDRLKASNLGFSYKTAESNPQLTTGSDPLPNPYSTTLIDWASGVDDDTLRLDLEFDLKDQLKINTVTYTPYGLEDNKNRPVKIVKIQTSSDGTDWNLINPQNVYVGTDASLESARAANNVTIGAASWTFDERTVQYIRMSIEQNYSIPTNIGHVYYERLINDNTAADTGVSTERIEGPVPSVVNPIQYYGGNGLSRDDYEQNVERFLANRWTIGIRDINILKKEYQPTSVIVSKPFRMPGIVNRVAIEADYEIPSNFDNTSPNVWVKFYVSPDDGLNWYPISRIEDDFSAIPEIIAFNDPLPSEFREPGIQYVNTNSTVDALRLKIELTRPENLISSTPIVKSYNLKVALR